MKIRNYSFKQNLSHIIPPVNYLTHNLYSYPAKFIPHVPYYVISKFLKQKDGIILDPFAGSSSTAIEALRLGHNSICLDINPLTNFLTKAKTQRITFNLTHKTPIKLDTFLEKEDNRSADIKYNTIYITKFIERMKRNDQAFYPRWKNIDHWYPIEFKEVLANIWGYIFSIEDNYTDDFINLIKITALYVSRFLSYGARDVPKLFKSKRREKQIKKLRVKVKDNPNIPYDTFHNILLKYFNQMKHLTEYLREKNIFPEYEYEVNIDNIRSREKNKKKIICLGGKDVSSYEFPLNGEFVDLIITSPPYIYAQEYIRSTKLDLYWMNLVDDLKVRELTRRELGTKRNLDVDFIRDKLKNIEIFISTAEKLEKIELAKYKQVGKYTILIYNYFYDMYMIIEKLIRSLKQNGVFGLFIGNPTVLGYPVPCHKIFCEIFEELGLSIREFGYDEIISPRLLKGRQNLSPNGMKAEWLIIAQKERGLT